MIDFFTKYVDSSYGLSLFFIDIKIIFAPYEKYFGFFLHSFGKIRTFASKMQKQTLASLFCGITRAKNFPSARVRFSWLGRKNTNQGRGFKEKEKVLHP